MTPSWRERGLPCREPTDYRQHARAPQRESAPTARAGSTPLEVRGTLVEEGLQAFVHVLARGEDPEAARFEAQSLVERQLRAAHDALERGLDGERTVRGHRLPQPLALAEQPGLRHAPVDEPAPLGLPPLPPPPPPHPH